MTESLKQLIFLTSELYRISVSFLSSPEDYTLFTSRFHFHRVQKLITPESLRSLRESHPQESLLLTDPFSIHYLLLPVEGEAILFGPYCTLELSSQDAKILFRKHKIQDLDIQDFFSHYNSYPVLKESELLHILESLEKLTKFSFGMIRKIGSEQLLMDGVFSENEDIHRENELKLLEKRYAYEQQFILDIQNGNTHSALMNLHNMQADVKYLKRIGTTLENEKVASAITRTTVRLAAMQAKLPIYLIDQLSRRNTIQSSAARSVDEILEAKENMIREFCKAIRLRRSEHYSALTQTILYHLDHHYYQAFSMEELAEELNISKNYLIQKFRAETGTTPIPYLRKIRMRNAAALLISTDATLQEISSSVGIADMNYFIKQFKKEYGFTPHSYRKQFVTV